MIVQNEKIYNRVGDTIEISAGPSVRPLVIRLSPTIELYPLLESEGIIVQVGDVHIVGPATFRALGEARDKDPHYWYGINDTIELASGIKCQIGRTIPIIPVDITALEERANAQRFALRTAGVIDVDWSYDDAGVIPAGVLRQINWTLSPDAERPNDTYTLTELGLGADYSYETLEIAKPAAGGRIDPEAIGEIVRRVSARLKELRSDFNTIQSVYFDGKIPDGAPARPAATVNYSDSSTPPADPADNAGRQRIQRTTELISVDPRGAERVNAGVVSAIRTGG